MKKQILYTIVILAVIVVIVLFWKSGTNVVMTPITSSNPVFDQSTSDGNIKFTYSSSDFGLAVNKDQILVHSYIPPCDENFNYCLYYIGTDYNDTNFESAGIRIQKRTDLTGEKVCLNTAPSGFDSSFKPNATSSTSVYSSSIFSNVGEGAAGHLSSGKLYLLFIKGNMSCYEFETRIGQTQFANYPAGAIKEFSTEDQNNLQSKLDYIIEQISLSSGEKNLFAF